MVWLVGILLVGWLGVHFYARYRASGISKV